MATRTAQSLFNAWLRTDIAPQLKRAGWRKTANTFRLENDETIGVIQLTKSHWSRADHLWFWIKAGVWSRRLSELDHRIGVLRGSRSRLPGPDDCHWFMWHDTIMGPGDDWEILAISSRIELEILGNFVRQRLESLVIPGVTAHMSDAAIRDALDSGYRPLTGPRFGYLYALIEAIGPHERLPEVLVALRSREPAIAGRMGLA